MKIKITNSCTLEKVDLIFLEIIESAKEAYLNSISSNKIIEIRLMGSVPRGDARKKHSDIDFICLLNTQPSERELETIKRYEKILSEKYEQVRKVDLEVFEIKKIFKTKSFILNTDSINILGANSFKKAQVELSRKKLAIMTSPRMHFLISEYRNGLEKSNNDEEILQFSRWIGKDILKSFRYGLINKNGIYEKNPVKISKYLQIYHPKLKKLVRILENIYLNPIIEKTKLYKILEEVESKAVRNRNCI